MCKSVNKLNVRVNAASRALFVIVGLTLATWAATLSFGFVWDDLPTIVNNPSLHSWGTLGTAFTSDFWSLHDLPVDSGYWRPLPTIAYTFIVKLFGVNAFPLHALNLLLHIGVSICLFFLFGRLGLGDPGRGIAAVFFALHPIHAETVSFISALPDLMSALFGLMAVVAWSSPSKRRWWLGTFLFVLALLSKESAVAFGLLGFWLSPCRKRFLMVLFPILSLYAITHFAVTGGAGVRSLWGGELVTHVGTVIKLLPYTLFLAFVPINSSPTRAFSISTGWGDPFVWAALATIVVLFLLLFRFRNCQPHWGKGAILFGLFWLPVSNMIPAEGLLADRYLYLCVIGTSYVVGSLLGSAWSWKQNQKVCRAALVLFVGCWGSWAFASSLKWKSNETLWRSAIQVTPSSPVAWNEWGGVFLQKGKVNEAAEAFEEAVALQPNYPGASLNLLVARIQAGDIKRALKEAKRHLEMFPEDAAGWDLLGSIYARIGDLPKSIECAERAVGLTPGNWRFHFNLGLSHATSHDFAEAIQQFEEARRLAPNQQEVWFQLGFVYFSAAEWRKAERVFLGIVQKWPEEKRGEASLRKVQEVLAVTEGS